ncbi:hypothetical protein GCM10008995_11470 [Halobellus salinus]|mgnify:CR=1 FL=1|uniref:Uncharacterized protein n=1 Tax=Halobellus salinus TaxID=931585 RepID=A0A830E961_9EURY|nr:hypothetical protein [Halobellus salinus]GGJ03423.1 hypothetical protein GCM10008995_11470 [Halobellus salinus]SMP21401.1 hypothetical protein SAMN06265347_10879 [Halobellus salinus]
MADDTNLRKAAETADDLPDPHSVVGKHEEVPLTEVFDGAFVREHTEFDTFDEMVAFSPSEAATADELGTVGDGEWDAFVAETTVFEDEEAFVFAARDHWVAVRLGLE